MWCTYDGRVDEGTPTTFILEESQDKGDGGGTEQDEDELIFELLQDQVPQGRGRLFGDSWIRD
jgi:hypothetical protein